MINNYLFNTNSISILPLDNINNQNTLSTLPLSNSINLVKNHRIEIDVNSDDNNNQLRSCVKEDIFTDFMICL